jgi:hypothetical protein
MIALGLCFINLGQTGRVVRGNPVDWLALTIGPTAILLSFLSDYGLAIARRGLAHNPLGLQPELRAVFAAHVPTNYPWWLLAFGLAVIVWAAFFRIYPRSLHSGPTTENKWRSPLEEP